MGARDSDEGLNNMRKELQNMREQPENRREQLEEEYRCCQEQLRERLNAIDELQEDLALFRMS
jgi:FtsZ-binding cell division protein ZapB